MNKLDLDYQALLSDIMDNGVEKKVEMGKPYQYSVGK